MTRIRRLAVPMRGRSPDETHRSATPLELFFDLVFVVAVAQVSSELHHGLLEDDLARTLVSYVFVFGAIWWAWMNFTWFASGFDTDDVAYRLTVFVQLAGALVLAAGVPAAFEKGDWRIVLLGYVIMRLAVVTQWLRVARDDPLHRRTAVRFAAGITVSQILWVAGVLWSPSWFVLLFIGLYLLELVVPIWAGRTAPTPWHPEHMAERYGLFTIIVLGETILSASLAVASIWAGGVSMPLLGILLGGLVTVFVMWWLYFYEPVHDLLTSRRTAFVWGYGHFPVWAAAAAVGAGLAVAIEQTTGADAIHPVDAVAAGYAVAVPVAIYLVGVWLLHGLPRLNRWSEAVPVAATIVAILAVPLTGWGVPLTGVALAGLLGSRLATRRNAAATMPP